MRARILNPGEWCRLVSEAGPQPLLDTVPEAHVAVVVVEDEDGEIVAAIQVHQWTHFEGAWVREDKRGNPGVMRALLRQAFAIPGVRSEGWLVAGAEEGQGGELMRKLLPKLGGHRLPVEFYAVPVPVQVEGAEEGACRKEASQESLQMERGQEEVSCRKQ